LSRCTAGADDETAGVQIDAAGEGALAAQLKKTVAGLVDGRAGAEDRG
jgi:hypothetical protein